MKASVILTVIFLFLFFFNLYSEDMYTTKLTVTKSDGKIKIEWNANTNHGIFNIYRNKKMPIYNLSVLSNSLRIVITNHDGVKEKSIYKFLFFLDLKGEEGEFYLAVLPMPTKFSEDDLRPELNYMLNPIIISNKDNINEGYTAVNNIFIKTNTGQVMLFWDYNADSDQSIKFSVYRTTNLISDEQLLFQMAPYKEVNNELYIEDDDLKYGIPYYYTIIANDFKIIKPDKNQNTIPVIFGFTNINIKIEKEVLSKTNISMEEFQKKFKK